MLEYYLLLILTLFYVVSGLFIFCSRHKHLLVTLLSLEYVMLNIFLILMMNVSWDSSESYLALIFLIFAVAEGSVGLSLLVSLSRSHGTDQLKSFNLLW